MFVEPELIAQIIEELPEVTVNIQDTNSELQLAFDENTNITDLELEQDRNVLKPMADETLFFANSTRGRPNRNLHYNEDEIRPSEATVDSEDLPSNRL